MKKFLLFLCGIFLCAVCHSETLDISWYVGDNLYTTTQCNSGGDLILPTPPSKPGYNFVGWRNNFTLVEYLESTGTQYIDTGFVPNNNTRVKVKVKFNNVANYHTGVFGASNWVAGNGYRFFLWDSKVQCDYDKTNILGATVSVGDIIELDFNKNVVNYFKNDWLQPQLAFDASTFTSPFAMTLFGGRTETGAAPAYFGENSIYYFQIYDNDVLVRDFVPVIDAAGVPCMWDKVSETFFYNAGTGNFIAGPVVEE